MEKRTKNSIHNNPEVFFPDDIIVQILSWLPVLSLLRFKSVCKSWYALINRHSFINQHLRNHQPLMNNSKDSDFLILDGDLSVFYQLNAHTLQLSPQIHLPPFFPNDVLIYDMISCNGLLCVHYTHKNRRLDGYAPHFVLWNPTTKQHRVLPQPQLQCYKKPRQLRSKPWFVRVYLGFGFDITTNNYYAVLFSAAKEDPSSGVMYSQVSKYSLINDSWSTKRVAFPKSVWPIISSPETQAQFGIYSWLGSSYSYQSESLGATVYDHYILSFNFTHETFDTIPLPQTDSIKRGAPRLAVLKGCIACINESTRSSSPQFEIWLLKEYGVNESWYKLYTTVSFVNRPFPYGLLKDGECFLFVADNQLCIYDSDVQEVRVVTQELKKLGTYLNSYTYLPCSSYTESLVSVLPTN